MNRKRDYLFGLLLVSHLFLGIFHPVAGYGSRSSKEMESIASHQSEEVVEESDTGELVEGSQSGIPEENSQSNGESNSASKEDVRYASNDESASDSEQEENAENYFEDCDVPIEELDFDYCNCDNEGTEAYSGETCDRSSGDHNPQGTIWPQGVVKYTLDESLNDDDIKRFYEAVEEYHSKTCIKFVPVDEGEIGSEESEDYTKIWMNHFY